MTVLLLFCVFSGLGLAISRQLARAMGGDLSYAYLDEHCVFELRLPRAQGEDRQKVATAGWPSAAAAGVDDSQGLGERTPGAGSHLAVDRHP